MASLRAGRARPSAVITALSIAVSLVLVGVIVTIVTRHRAGRPLYTAASLAGMPAGVTMHTVEMMGLAPTPPTPAPGFALTDQHGARVSLSSLRGRVVVFQPMDSHCTDICPLISKELVDAYHDLGPLAAKVVFVGLNVNEYHGQVADVEAFSSEHALDTIPTWHFLTGAPAQLKPVWKAYGIQVQAPNPNADIVHTSVIEFIDPRGVERYLAQPIVDHAADGSSYLPPATLTAWGQGIAATARQLAS